MFGDNPKRPPEVTDGSKLKVQSIFLTLQGEGPYTGRAAIFIRLGGCNLACSFCDTEFESFNEMELASILDEVETLRNGSATDLIVITGGEPFRQSIGSLCQKLLGLGFRVQIETNGTLYQSIPEGTEVVCSPKPSNGKYFPVHPEITKYIVAYKFLVSKFNAGYGQVPDWEFGSLPVYVQPIDLYDSKLDNESKQKNIENSKLAIDFALKKGYIYSTQIHKIIGIE